MITGNIRAGWNRKRRFMGACIAAGLICLLDLSAKWAVSTILMDPPRRIPILPFFDLVLVFNHGISFGLLSGLGVWGPTILSGVAAGIIGMLIVWLWRTNCRNEAIGITLIIGGAMGNLLDRLHDKAVTDFLNLYVGPYHWPVFNGADVFITLGVLCWFLPKRGNKKPLSFTR